MQDEFDGLTTEELYSMGLIDEATMQALMADWSEELQQAA